QGNRARERRARRQRLLGAGPPVCQAVLPAAQGLEGGRPDQALGAIGRRGAVRIRPGDRARIAAATVPERRREGRHRGQSGKADGGVQGEVKTDLFINNEWRPAASGRRFPVVNPATEEVIAEVALGDAADVDAAVKGARACFDSDGWRKLSARQRGRLLAKTADLLEARLDEFARLETAHNGKTLFESKIELGMTVNTLRYYAGWADKIVGDTLPVEGPFFVYTLREPIGVVGAIVPWNFPLNIASWKFAPALAAGCTVVLEPASATPLTA